MTTSSSSVRPPNTAADLSRPAGRVWLFVLAAFAGGLAVGAATRSAAATIAILAAATVVSAAILAGSRRSGPPPQRLRPLGLSPVFSVKLGSRALVVGRSEDCDVTLPLETVSGQHCRLHNRRGRWFVEDLGSLNGIRVNGKAVRKGRLRVGDTLSVADFDFRVC